MDRPPETSAYVASAQLRFWDAIARCEAAEGTEEEATARAELGATAWNLAHVLLDGLDALAWMRARRLKA